MKLIRENNMNEYHPDSWVVVKYGMQEHDVHRLIAGWSGGYLDGDSWRMNSGITRVEDAEDCWRFYGESGSCYVVHKDGYAMRMSMSGIYNRIKDHVELLDEDTDWMNFDWKVEAS